MFLSRTNTIQIRFPNSIPNDEQAVLATTHYDTFDLDNFLTASKLTQQEIIQPLHFSVIELISGSAVAEGKLSQRRSKGLFRRLVDTKRKRPLVSLIVDLVVPLIVPDPENSGGTRISPLVDARSFVSSLCRTDKES